MKTLVLSILCCVLAATLFAAADYSSMKQGVTIHYRDDRTNKLKLDFIDNSNVTVIVQGSDGKLQFVKEPRNTVDWLSIDGRDQTNKFAEGEQGAVMMDGRVLKGEVVGLDATNFFLQTPRGTRENLDRDKVAFIQFKKQGAVKPVPAPGPPKRYTVSVSARNPWTPTEVVVKEGQKVAFTVDKATIIMCGGVPNVNADGVNPYTPDPRRPVPDAKACALIGSIGKDVFRIGTNETAYPAKTDGKLNLGINDSKFQGNGGAFTVFIVVY